jgi:hypothetical protein
MGCRLVKEEKREYDTIVGWEAEVLGTGKSSIMKYVCFDSFPCDDVESGTPPGARR